VYKTDWDLHRSSRWDFIFVVVAPRIEIRDYKIIRPDGTAIFLSWVFPRIEIRDYKIIRPLGLRTQIENK